MVVAKDIFDNELNVGDVVAYSVTVGQTSRMRIGRVTKLFDDKVTASGWSKFQYQNGEVHWTNKKGTVKYSHAKVLKLDPGSLDPELERLMNGNNEEG